MSVQVARHVGEVLDNLSSVTGATLLAGGTDLLVEINFGRARPTAVVAIDRVAELKNLERNGRVRMGALVTYTRMLDDDPGSPALPVLAALDATIVLRSAKTERRLRFGEFMTGPKKSARRPDELIVAAEWDDAGPAQTFMKVGTRNAMVIAVAGLALVVDRVRKRVGAGLGSCGPTIIRAAEAERFAEVLFADAGWERPSRPSDAAAKEFGRLVAAAAKPIDDVRGTAAYRRHVLAVMGARALARVAAIA